MIMIFIKIAMNMNISKVAKVLVFAKMAMIMNTTEITMMKI